MGYFCFQRNRDVSAAPWPRPGGLRAGRGPGFSLFSRADLTAFGASPWERPGPHCVSPSEAGDAPTPCEARQAGGLPGPASPRSRGCRRAEAAPRPGRPRVPAPARRHGNRPARGAGRRVTHSAVVSAGMRSAGPSVRSPRPEQLTRQAAPGAGPHRQGGAHGPQPRPGPPASAPSHRPRPRASARRAGAAGGIVRAARAWPRPGPEPPSPPGAGGRGSGGARGLHGGARGGIRRRPRPVCLRDARSALGPGRTLRPRPAGRALALQCGPAAAPPPAPGAARGGRGRGVLRPRPSLCRAAARPGGRRGVARPRALLPRERRGWGLGAAALARPPASVPRRRGAPQPFAVASVAAVRTPAVVTPAARDL